jgi:hypothetical protein
MSIISLDRTGDAGRIRRDCCMLGLAQGRGGGWPRPINSRALYLHESVYHALSVSSETRRTFDNRWTRSC